jgi:Cu/Ag efflux protein CusF
MTLTSALLASPLAPIAFAESGDVPLAAGADLQEVTGTVVVVNQETRMLTIRKPDGVFEVIHVPAEVQRLDEIRIDDTLAIAYLEAVAIDLQTGDAAATESSATASVEVDREAGALPAGSLQETITLVGIVEGIDKARSKITIRGPERTVTLKVRDSTRLDGVTVGDSVSLTYLNAVAATVTRANPPHHTRPGSQ